MTDEELDGLYDELWPITRSITGPGFVESLKIISKFIPFKEVKLETGTKVFDWEIPPEWKLNRATLSTEDGKKILDTADSNLHVVNFSEPFSGIIDFEELNKHLYSHHKLMDAVPYVTSYYKRRWGLCISENQRKTLDKQIRYVVDIDTSIYPGYLTYGEFTLPGRTSETILLTTYLCHPSMANNELSGPLVMSQLYDLIKNLENRHYTYKFIIVPETIGSIAFLSNSSSTDLKNIVAGIVLTCLGGPNLKLSFKHTRLHWTGRSTDVDRLALSFCSLDETRYAVRQFTPINGSDERQFCSPGINLPVIQAAKTLYGDYDEYHTSLDNKDFMCLHSIKSSAQDIFLFLKAFELNKSALASNIEGGEAMLSKYDLYPTINSSDTNRQSSDVIYDERNKLNLILMILSLCDGTKTLREIAEFCDITYKVIVPIVDELIELELIHNL